MILMYSSASSESMSSLSESPVRSITSPSKDWILFVSFEDFGLSHSSSKSGSFGKSRLSFFVLSGKSAPPVSILADGPEPESHSGRPKELLPLARHLRPHVPLTYVRQGMREKPPPPNRVVPSSSYKYLRCPAKPRYVVVGRVVAMLHKFLFLVTLFLKYIVSPVSCIIDQTDNKVWYLISFILFWGLRRPNVEKIPAGRVKQYVRGVSLIT